MRSGIGPADKLRALGIEVIQDLPGIGGNLRNKPKVDIAVHLRAASTQSPNQRGLGQNFLRYTSSVLDCSQHDMSIKFVNKTAWHPLGRRIGGITVCLHQPYSIGSVELASADPTVGPVIRFNVLSDPRDFERLVEGLRIGFDLLSDREVVKLCNEVFLPSGKIVARLNNPTRRSYFQACLLSSLMSSRVLRRAMLKRVTLDLDALLKDNEALRGIVRRHVGLGWHVCGTCKMGADADPMAVLNPQCRVRGVAGLRVVDASIYPTSAGEQGMHISVLMVAEKMADVIKAQWAEAEREST
jgi:5-(hydroxymethyl)furfural/furfural oxidase